MSIEYDEKGKFYTDIITKQPVSVVIQTSLHLIRGFVHVRQGERLKNELENDEVFLAVTNASVVGADEKVLFAVPFMAVRRSQIVWVMPLEEKPEDMSA
ncbi:MAG: hypothetical protein HY863_15420 [Chloroflexi bacterium]|nr:hypothetical protein [Chloroflexota bacterium]